MIRSLRPMHVVICPCFQTAELMPCCDTGSNPVIHLDAEKASSAQHWEYFAPPFLAGLLQNYDWEMFRNVWADKIFKICFLTKIERNVTFFYLFCQTETGHGCRWKDKQIQQLSAAQKDSLGACPLLWGLPAHPESIMGRRFWISDRFSFYQCKGNTNQYLQKGNFRRQRCFLHKKWPATSDCWNNFSKAVVEYPNWRSLLTFSSSAKEFLFGSGTSSRSLLCFGLCYIKSQTR